MDQSRSSTHRQHDRPPSSPTDETAEGPEQDTPYTEAPAAAGHIHDVFAEYEKEFGAGSFMRKSGRPKGRSSPPSRRTNPVVHGSPALDNPYQQSVNDEHGVQDPDGTIASKPSEIESGGSSTGCLTNIERENGGSSSQMEGQQRRESAERTPTQPNPPSRKRSGAPEESHVPAAKRSRGSSRLSARRSSEAKKMSTRSNSHKEERLRHAFPRQCRDKQWDVQGIGRISVGGDGSLDCELLWAPTTVSVSTLNGALLERAEELVKQNHGVETWDKWLEIQGKTGRRRCHAEGGNSQREK